jgi:hypothetical protein
VDTSPLADFYEIDVINLKLKELSDTSDWDRDGYRSATESGLSSVRSGRF